MPADFSSIGAVAQGTGVTSLATNAPSGSGGQLVLAVVNSNAVTFTTPTNWTVEGSAADGFNAQRTAVYTRISDGTSDDTPTLAFGGSTDATARIMRLADTHATTPRDTQANATQTTGSTAAVAGLTTAEADEVLVAVIGTDGSAINSDPSGWTQRSIDNGTGRSLGIWTRTAPTAGAYGTETANLSFSDQATRITSAYKSAAGGGGGGSIVPLVMQLAS